MPTESAQKPVAREYLEALLIAVVFATFARTFVFQAFKIPSGSMEENLLIGDHILVNKFIYGPTPSWLERTLLPAREVRRGDVVVFKFPEDPSRDFIKRAVGLPGDRIQMVDKHLFVNGQRVFDDTYTHHTDPITYSGSSYPRSSLQRDNFGPLVVPANSYFCLGDNRDNSRDSRFWGMVPRDNLKGRALLVYWSFDDVSAEQLEWPGLAGAVRRVGHVATRFFASTRWNRTWKVVR
jgi:signal peptidase I